MSTPLLTLPEMLKEEYEYLHGPLPRFCLSDPLRLARSLNAAPASDEVALYIKSKLSRESRQELEAPRWAPEAKPKERLLDELYLKFYDLLRDPEFGLNDPRLGEAFRKAGVPPPPQGEPLSTSALPEDERMRVNLQLFRSLYPDFVEEIKVPEGEGTPSLADVFRVIHHSRRSALCLSGGGIRSATFNLGVLQGLARHGLLGRFDYLSTVSGGGFIGGWLSAWIHRHPRGLAGVVGELSDPPTEALEPDAHPISWLRVYSNFLTPKPGLLNADTWTLVTMVLRNLLLNWVVFVPWLVAALLLPRMWVSFLSNRTFEAAQTISLVVGLAAGAMALVFVALNLPSAHPTRSEDGDGQGAPQTTYLLLHLLPFVLSAMALTTFWARYTLDNKESYGELGGWEFTLYAAALVALPWAIAAAFQLIHAKNKWLAALLSFPVATAAVALGLWLTGQTTRAVADEIFSPTAPGDDPRFYACFAVPVLLGLLTLGGTFLAGFTSGFTSGSTFDEDQEWWARAGAWLLIVMVAWVVVSVIVLYGPSLFLDLPLWRLGWKFWTWEWDKIGKALGIVAGVVSGAVTLFGGFSAGTPANEKEARQSGIGHKALSIATLLLGPVFLAFILILLSLAADGLLAAFPLAVEGLLSATPFESGLSTVFNPLLGLLQWLVQTLTGWEAGTVPVFAQTDHLSIIRHSPLRLIILLALFVVAVGLVMGLLISTNRFSLHYMWRNRIIRAYLGASNRRRQPNRFTGFDSDDNLYMHELRKGVKGEKKKLFHVLNFALNLTGGSRLDWQDRKSESFTASPLHCGSFQPADRRFSREPLGYRDSRWYGGDNGISLGTSVAISGAFVSPNMGYMMTSPVVRFLMTLFNVRFGWWLGNPRHTTYRRSSPRLSVKPIAMEALGMTDDRASYVYLSDGGHFENLGLYEMVLRRCHFVFVSDASTDNEYSFGSLGMAVRQIRVDLGVPIEFTDFTVIPPAEGKDGRSCAIGRIRYSCVDKQAPDGVLVYLKPTLTGSEPRDVLNYARDNPSFPQEVIVDQWFSEAQFESYRALGSYIVNDLAGAGDSRSDQRPEDFLHNVEKYIGRNPSPGLRELVRECLGEIIREDA